MATGTLHAHATASPREERLRFRASASPLSAEIDARRPRRAAVLEEVAEILWGCVSCFSKHFAELVLVKRKDFSLR